MYERILVAVDTTDESDTVLDHTAALAKLSGAPVRVLHIRTVEVVDGGTIGSVVENEDEDHADAYIRQAVERLRAAGVVSVEGRGEQTVRADVPGAIIQEVKDFGADLLVMGARRRGGLAGFLFGSVSDAVAHHAPCAMLLVNKKKQAE